MENYILNNDDYYHYITMSLRKYTQEQRINGILHTNNDCVGLLLAVDLLVDFS